MEFSTKVPKMFPGDKNQKLSFPAYNSNKNQKNDLLSKLYNNFCYDKDLRTHHTNFNAKKIEFSQMFPGDI